MHDFPPPPIQTGNINSDPLNSGTVNLDLFRHQALEYIRRSMLGVSLVDQNIPPHLRALSNFDVWELSVFVGHFIKAAQKRGWVPPGIFYYPSYPDIEFTDLAQLVEQTHDSPHPKSPPAIITWRVVKRDHASIDTQPFTGRRPAKPFFGGQAFNITNEIQQLLVSGQDVPDELFKVAADGHVELYDILSVDMWMWDNMVRFDVFAKTAGEAEKYAIAFEKMLYANSGLFRLLGADKFLHWGRTPDSELDNRDGSEIRVFANRVGLKFRSIQWYMRTQEFMVSSEKTISEIGLEWFADEQLNTRINTTN